MLVLVAEAFNLTVYEGLWVNCTKPLPSAAASGEMCKSTNGRGETFVCGGGG